MLSLHDLKTGSIEAGVDRVVGGIVAVSCRLAVITGGLWKGSSPY